MKSTGLNIIHKTTNNMKKLILTLFAAVIVALGASAQRTTLNIGYGGYTQMDATDCHDGGHSVNTAWGAITAGAQFQINPKMWVGPSYTFSSTSRKGSDENKFYYHAIMLNGRYNYYSNSIMKMYAKVGLGAVVMHETYKHDSKNKGYFAYQISPVCADFPLSNQVALFGELGFGAQGLLQVGLKVNL